MTTKDNDTDPCGSVIADDLDSVHEGVLRFTQRDGIATLTIDRPQAYNAFTLQMYRDLAQVCARVGESSGARVLLITSATERAFASGTDINTFRQFSQGSDALAYERLVDETLTQLEHCRVPTIAAINGVCAGGGLAIAACCDLRIAQDNLRLGMPMAKSLGNCLSPENITRLTALVGAARLKQMLFTATLFDAATAREWGLVAEVLPDHAALLQRAAGLAHDVAALAPITLRVTKQAILRLRGAPVPAQDLIEEAYLSEDFREGMEAFLNKRQPVWRGK